jgi:hypothetical protein
VPSLPPSKGHYVDYSAFPVACDTLATATVQGPSALAPADPNDIPIDPLLLDMSRDISGSSVSAVEPTIKRLKTSTSSLPSLSTSSSTPGSSGSYLSRNPSISTVSPTTPYNLAALSLNTPISQHAISSELHGSPIDNESIPLDHLGSPEQLVPGGMELGSVSSPSINEGSVSPVDSDDGTTKVPAAPNDSSEGDKVPNTDLNDRLISSVTS